MRLALLVLFAGSLMSGCSVVYRLPQSVSDVSSTPMVVDERPRSEIMPMQREQLPIIFLGDHDFSPDRLAYLHARLSATRARRVVVHHFRTLIYAPNAVREASTAGTAGFLGPVAARLFYDLTHRPGLPFDFFLTEIELEIDGQRYSRAAAAPFTGLIDMADGRRAAIEVHEKMIDALLGDIEKGPNQAPEPTAHL